MRDTSLIQTVASTVRAAIKLSMPVSRSIGAGVPAELLIDIALRSKLSSGQSFHRDQTWMQSF